MRVGSLAEGARARYRAARREEFYPKADLALDDAVLRRLATLDSQITEGQALLALTESGFSPQGLIPMLPSGTFHELYSFSSAGDDLVLKVNRVPTLLEDLTLLTEFAVSRTLVEAGVSHGTVRHADCSREIVAFDFQVLDRVAGVSLRADDNADATAAAWLPPLAATLRTCHGITGDGYGLVANLDESAGELKGGLPTWGDYLRVQLDRHIAIASDAGLLNRAEASQIERAFADGEAIPNLHSGRLLHGDCGPHNAVGSDTAVALIDWEDSVIGDPLFDVAMWATFTPERRWAAFFAAYFDAEWVPDAAFWTYFLRVSLAKSVVRLRFDYKDVPGRSPPSARLQRALDGLAHSSQ